MSIYTVAEYTVYWKFPTAVERAALPNVTINEVGRIAWQQDDDSFWVLLSVGGSWLQLNASAIPGDMPIVSSSGDTILAGKQRIIYGDYEIVGSLTLEGDLVLI